VILSDLAKYSVIRSASDLSAIAELVVTRQHSGPHSTLRLSATKTSLPTSSDVISSLLVVSPEVTCKTDQLFTACPPMSVHASVRFQHLQNLKAPRPLRRCRWNLPCIFCGSVEQTSRKHGPRS